MTEPYFKEIRFKDVSEQELDEFVKNYPRPLERDAFFAYEPPLITWNDFSDGKVWPESVVAKSWDGKHRISERAAPSEFESKLNGLGLNDAEITLRYRYYCEGYAAGKKVHHRCMWTEVDNDVGAWETSCGNAHILIAGTPQENEMNFCCYCGGDMHNATMQIK